MAIITKIRPQRFTQWNNNLPLGWRTFLDSIARVTVSRKGESCHVCTSHPMTGIVKETLSHGGRDHLIIAPVRVVSGNVGLLIGRKDGRDDRANIHTHPLLSEPLNTASIDYFNPVQKENFFVIVDSTSPARNAKPQPEPSRGSRLSIKVEPNGPLKLVKQFPEADRTFILRPVVTKRGRILVVYIQRFSSPDAFKPGDGLYRDPRSPFPADGGIDDRDSHLENLGLLEIDPVNYTLKREQVILAAAETHQHNLAGGGNSAGLLETDDGRLMLMIEQTPSIWGDEGFHIDLALTAPDGWTFRLLGKGHTYPKNVNCDEPQIVEVGNGIFKTVARTDTGHVYMGTYDDKEGELTVMNDSGIVACSNTNNVFRLPDGRMMLSVTSDKHGHYFPRRLAVCYISSDGLETITDVIFVSNATALDNRSTINYAISSGVNDWSMALEPDGRLAFWGWNVATADILYQRTMTIPPRREGYSVSKLTGGKPEILSVSTKGLPRGEYEILLVGVVGDSSDFYLDGEIVTQDIDYFLGREGGTR